MADPSARSLSPTATNSNQERALTASQQQQLRLSDSLPRQHHHLVASPLATSAAGPHTQARRQHAHYYQARPLQKNATGQMPPPTPPATSKVAAARADTVKPHYQRGHQRRQSVARLLPDISKLRLLSWLVEASNELINCDIAIMDGVYAKLNRSRESLLFWQQQAAGSSSRPAPPMPPSVQPVANKNVISQRQKLQQQQQQQTGRNKLAGHKLSRSSAKIAHRNHHSLPLTNYDSSSLAAVPTRSNKTIPLTASSATAALATGDDVSILGSPSTSTAAQSISASLSMMQQNLQLQQQERSRAITSKSQPTANGRANCQLPIGFACDSNSTPPPPTTPTTLTTAAAQEPDYCDSNQSDDDDNSSAASSTTSSGIHGTSSSSSSSSAASCSASSAASTSSAASCASSSIESSSFVEEQRHQATGGKAGSAAAAAVGSAEQLSERIRKAVMEHNYLQNLLVNVIRQHDRRRDLHERQHQHQMATMRQQQRADLYSRSPLKQANQIGATQLPRIDLADIADALDDGCQCTCHAARLQPKAATPAAAAAAAASTSPARQYDVESASLPSSVRLANNRASTLPSSSSLSLFQAPSRKNRSAKKHSEPSREDLIQRLSDKLCESCFETHHWLHGCAAIESNQLNPSVTIAGFGDGSDFADHESPSSVTTTTNNINLGAGKGFEHEIIDASPLISGQQHQQNSKHADGAAALDSVISLRNATFIKLVQQQVRATISNSIELIDLIRKEIKSPESIKQKQLMRCFSASIQLLSSVANYVVPSQDISTFIPAEMVPGNGNLSINRFGGGSAGAGAQQQQATILFNLPSSDFDHLLLYPAGQAAPCLGQSPLSNPYTAASNLALLNHNQLNNYHLAQAPEIPIRRRNLQQHVRLRRSSDEACMVKSQHQMAGCNSLGRGDSSRAEAAPSCRSLPLEITNSATLVAAAVKSDLPSEINKASSTLADSRPCDLNSKNDKSKTLDLPNSAQIGTSERVVVAKATSTDPNGPESSSGASSNTSSASSSMARGQVQQSSLTKAPTSNAILNGKTSHDLSFERIANLSQHDHTSQHGHGRHQTDDEFARYQSGRAKFWQSSKFNFIKKLLQVKQQRLLRQQSKDRRIYNNKVANKFRLVMMDLTHFNKSQQLLTTENGVNSLLTSMRNVLEFGLYLTVKLY